MNDQHMQQSDHDLLVTLLAKVDAFIAGQTDHETRLRALEKSDNQNSGSKSASRSLVIILFSVAGVIEPLILSWVFNK